MVENFNDNGYGTLWASPEFKALRLRIEGRIESLVEKMISGRKEDSMRENAARIKELKNLLRDVEAAFNERNNMPR